MIKKTVFFASLMLFSSVNASDSCVKLTSITDETGRVGTLQRLDDCTAIWNYLKEGRFPTVFGSQGSSNVKLYPGACYLSDPENPVLATLEMSSGKKQFVTITSQSAITTEFAPVLLGGTDTIGNAITRFKITGANQRELGTVDVVDVIGFDISELDQGIIRSTELNTPVNGDKKLKGVTGSIKIQSVLDLTQPDTVTLTKISGELCYNASVVTRNSDRDIDN